ncbi:hypothetical protein DFH08DRAFT_1072720 [Mycena albidolilacea]|uniref:Uncharacterized protein n=1 Tax=Mycena albidolilacea TaxID=1033008 RepID=A0AAD7AMV0_9AGAR|nr:hypothetical protein DFH08DRAFT_1072720 [Mycena albidolilacea]
MINCINPQDTLYNPYLKFGTLPTVTPAPPKSAFDIAVPLSDQFVRWEECSPTFAADPVFLNYCLPFDFDGDMGYL